MKKVLMLATTAAMIEQFNKENILILIKMGYEVHVAGNFKNGNPISEDRIEKFKNWIRQNNGRWYHIPASRNPFDVVSNYWAYKTLLELMRQNQYEFIHCHTPIGAVIGRFAAHKKRIKVVYTAHGFHFYKGAPIKNWILYYPVEKFLSKWTDMIITINYNDYQLAKENFNAKRTIQIPGVGIDIDKINKCGGNRNFIRKNLGLSEDDFVIMSVGEINGNKNQSVIIRAIHEISDKKIKYLICGKGSYAEKLTILAENLNIRERVRILGFRDDVFCILKAADCFAFPSKREGLGLAALEAMAAGLPLITSNSGGILEYSINNVTGFIHSADDVAGFKSSIETLAQNPQLRAEMGNYNKEAVKKYSIQNVNVIMEKAYQTVSKV